MEKRGRKPLPPDQRRKTVLCTLTPITLAIAKREAERDGLSLSAFVSLAVEKCIRARSRCRHLLSEESK